MAGRHRAQPPPRRRRGRHRAQRPRAQRGLASLAAVTVLTGVGVGTAWWALQGGAHPGSHHGAAGHGRAFLEAQSGHQKHSDAAGAGKSAQPNRAQRRAAGNAGKSRPTLVVRTLGATSWVQVVNAQGHVLVSHDVPPHQRLAFSQHHLTVTLGNAGAVALRIGSHHIDPAGHSGEVGHYTVS